MIHMAFDWFTHSSSGRWQRRLDSSCYYAGFDPFHIHHLTNLLQRTAGRFGVPIYFMKTCSLQAAAAAAIGR
jgi:hypothetical protein